MREIAMPYSRVMGFFWGTLAGFSIGFAAGMLDWKFAIVAVIPILGNFLARDIK